MTSNNNPLPQIDPEQILCHPGIYAAGSGSFGDVLVGYYVALGIFVAVKVFRFNGGPAEKKQAAEEEIGHLCKVNHKNIVRYLGWVEWPFTIGIVMEYCEGGNLKNLLKNHYVEIPMPVRVRMLLDLAKALASCHALKGKRLVHGDVKPENGLIKKDLTCKVCDFGGAEMATTTTSINSEDSSLPRRSKKDRIQLTNLYTAPEKLQDPGMKPTKKLDVYAFALFIHMFLTRDNPYPNSDQESLVDAIKQGRRPNCHKIEELKQTLNENERRIVEELEQMMKECWDQDPSARPTMTEVSERLQQLLDQQDTEVLQQQVAEVIRKMDIKDPFPVDHLDDLVPFLNYNPETRRFVESVSTSRSIRPPALGEDTKERTNSSESNVLLGRRKRLGDHMEGINPSKRRAEKGPVETGKPEQPHFSGQHDEDCSKFLVIGGESKTGDSSATRCVKYDPTTAGRREMAQLNSRRVCPASVKINNKVYVLGGADTYMGRQQPHKSVEVLDWDDPTSWSPSLEMLRRRKWFGCTNIRDKIYVVAGFDGSEETKKSFEMLDTNTNRWEELPGIDHGRYGNELVAFGDSLYCFGGYDDERQLVSCEHYDPREGRWRNVASMNQKRAGFASAVLDRKIYAIGGCDGTHTLTSVERYDPTANKWEDVAPLNIDRHVTAACVLGSEIYVIGGYRSRQKINTDIIECYDSRINIWVENLTTQKPIHGSTVVPI